MRPAPFAPESAYRFFASEISYFSGKVRPALRYKRVPYVEVLPTPAVYRQIIRPRTGLNMIPVVVTPDDETWQDSSDILDALEAHHPDPPLYPATPVQRAVAALVELYADEFLILPGLHYRWSFPDSIAKARADFAIATGDASSANRFADAVNMAVPLLGVVPASIPAIEAHTHELLDALSAHFTRHPYLLGERPSLADCALIGPFYAHLYLDAAPGRLLRERALPVCSWIERMNHPDPASIGDWLADDAVAPTLAPVLKLIGQDAVPFVLDIVRAFEAWADGNPTTDELPRGVGMHPTSLRGASFERFTTPYTHWMLERTRAAYAPLRPAARAAVDRALAGTGCDAALAWTPRHRVARRPFKLFLERIA
jgi:glutathione S-transferase